MKTKLSIVLLLLIFLVPAPRVEARTSLAELQAQITALEAELETLRQQLAALEGSAGSDGINCWDLNANGVGDAAEDVNGDGAWTAADCGADLEPVYDLINELSTRLDLLILRLENVDADNDGYPPNQGDCNDADAAINPLAQEILGDGIDNDCDGNIDLLADNDGDGFTVEDGDCDNFDPNTYPGAPELRDGIDNDCDGTLDDEDRDGDGLSVLDGDCDDSNIQIYPGAFEIPNNIDNDCDGTILDEDHDRDGFTRLDGDCNDNDSAVRPNQTQFFNRSSTSGFDYNCDGAIERLHPEFGNCQNLNCTRTFRCGFSTCTETYDCYSATQSGWYTGGFCGNTGIWVNAVEGTPAGRCFDAGFQRTQSCR